MKYSLDKYKFYHYLNKETGGHETVAISTYAGKAVRGVAKCHANDGFDPTKGEKLAAARCNLKIANKRKNRALKKVEEAKRLVAEAQRHLDHMYDYLADSTVEMAMAEDELNDLLVDM